jgi:hypothetical protein
MPTNRLMTLPLSLELEGLADAFEDAATAAMMMVKSDCVEGCGVDEWVMERIRQELSR